MNRMMKKMGKSLLRQGQQLLERSPAVDARPDTRKEAALKKLQKILDDAGVAAHYAKSQKDMDRLNKLLDTAQKHFTVAFNAQRKAGKG
jgi:predicted ArsR family transcriptional regulator